MAHNSERVIKPDKGLSFINWDELNEEEYNKLDRIINNSSSCSGVQFPFKGEDEKNTAKCAQIEKVGEPPIFQPMIPPPPIVGFTIPVPHWTQGDPAVGPPPAAHYPITVQGGYVFTNPALAASGEATVAFVPTLSPGQPLYAIPGVPGSQLPPHYQTTALQQTEPVDLSVTVTGSPANFDGHPLTKSGTLVPASPTHSVIMTQITQEDVSVNSAVSHIVPQMPYQGIPHPQATQLIYIPQSNTAQPQPVSNRPEVSATGSTTREIVDPRSQSPAKTGLPRAPSIEFGGPVIFNCHSNDDSKSVKRYNNKMLSQDKTVNKEVVIDMENIRILDDVNNTNGLKTNTNSEDNKTGSTELMDAYTPSATIVEATINTLTSPSDTSGEVSTSQSAVTPSPATQEKVAHSDTVSEPCVKQNTAPPVKMWSSLFGSKKSNAVSSVPTAPQSASTTTAAVPNAIMTDEVKSVRYWQEQDKVEAKQTIVPTQKVIPVGVQNDPLAPKIMEQLLSLPITHTPIVIQPRGLVNGSNTCFMNATLQVLMGCPPFVHMFRAFKNLPTRPGSSSSTPIFDSLVQFVNSFQNGQRIRNQGSRNKKGGYVDLNVGQPFTPTPLLSVAQNILGLHIGVQHDAEEFLSQILMICHEELENVMKLDHTDGLNNNDKEQTRNGYAQECDVHADEEDDDMTWQKVGPKNHHVETSVNDCGQTPLSSIFAGLSRSCLTRESGKTSDTVDSFFTLKLDIQADSVHCVKEALLRLNSIETVHDADGGKVQGQRRTFFDVLPPVLIMHLKLFQYSNGNGQKIQKKIDFDVDLVIPKETLSRVGKTKLASPKSRTYKLFGVVNHHGMKMNDGHYTSDVYLPAASGWLRFDDSEVMIIHETQVLQYSERRMPYLLFYRRMDVS